MGSDATLNALPAPDAEQRERLFFLAMAVAIAATVLTGFGAFALLGISSVRAPWWVHVHGISFMAWIGLYLTQNLLVFRGDTQTHRRLGRAGRLGLTRAARGGLVLRAGSRGLDFVRGRGRVRQRRRHHERQRRECRGREPHGPPRPCFRVEVQHGIDRLPHFRSGRFRFWGRPASAQIRRRASRFGLGAPVPLAWRRPEAVARIWCARWDAGWAVAPVRAPAPAAVRRAPGRLGSAAGRSRPPASRAAACSCPAPFRARGPREALGAPGS